MCEKSVDWNKISLGESIEFEHDCYNRSDEGYEYDTGILSILHVWAITSPELMRFENFQALNLVTTENIELFRQLVQLWFLGGNMNMLLYVTFEEESKVLEVNTEI